MVTRRDRHLQQSQENRAFAERLLRDSPHDATALQWAVTAAFYCGLHCLQWHLLGRNVNPRTHARREMYIADPLFGVPNDVYQAYQALRQRSQGARYALWRFTPAEVRAVVLDTHLKKVTDFAGI